MNLQKYEKKATFHQICISNAYITCQNPHSSRATRFSLSDANIDWQAIA